jgi:hypothetical protein
MEGDSRMEMETARAALLERVVSEQVSKSKSEGDRARARASDVGGARGGAHHASARDRNSTVSMTTSSKSTATMSTPSMSTSKHEHGTLEHT